MGTTVSLRHLNQRSGQVIAEVTRTGQAVTVTDRGRPVAQIIPYSEPLTPLDALRAQGQVRDATRVFTADTIARIEWPEGVTVASLLAEDREEDE